jgi:hypothetical protein
MALFGDMSMQFCISGDKWRLISPQILSRQRFRYIANNVAIARIDSMARNKSEWHDASDVRLTIETLRDIADQLERTNTVFEAISKPGDKLLLPIEQGWIDGRRWLQLWADGFRGEVRKLKATKNGVHGKSDTYTGQGEKPPKSTRK